MKKSEVKLWIDYHAELFPGWKYGPDSKAAKAMAFDSIAKALAQIDLAHAQEASDRMLAGTVKSPFRDEDVVAVIVKTANAVKSQRWAQDHPRVGGQETHSCPFCEDTGFVTCWRLCLVETMSVACSCKCGDVHAARWRGFNGEQRDAQRYDPEKCYRVGDLSDHWMGIRRQVEQDNQVDPPSCPAVIEGGRRLRASEVQSGQLASKEF